MIIKLLTVLFGALVVLGGIALYGVLPAFIAWLLYTYAVAPVFHFPLIGFWKCFCILWFLAVVINFLKPSKSA